MSTKVATAAVTASAAPMALDGHLVAALISLALGLVGVALARTVFISRQRRSTGVKQPVSETLPLTLTAMLIAGVIIWDRGFGISLSVFTGLGVGWTVIFLLDVLGAWVFRQGKIATGVTDDDLTRTPPDHQRLLSRLDRERGSDRGETGDPQ